MPALPSARCARGGSASPAGCCGRSRAGPAWWQGLRRALDSRAICYGSSKIARLSFEQVLPGYLGREIGAGDAELPAATPNRSTVWAAVFEPQNATGEGKSCPNTSACRSIPSPSLQSSLAQPGRGLQRPQGSSQCPFPPPLSLPMPDPQIQPPLHPHHPSSSHTPALCPPSTPAASIAPRAHRRAGHKNVPFFPK